jgi:OmcA/MtrC family decaheme c-type cytochrome
MNRKFRPKGSILFLSLAIFGASIISCVGDRGRSGAPAPVPPTPTTIERDQDLPGLNIAITGITGASNVDDTFRPGDRPVVTFTVTKDDGARLPLDELDSGSISISGPTFNYSIVIPSQSDLRTASVQNSDGSWTYTLPALPATYAAPLNSSGTAGSIDGNLEGLDLLAGTYTVGIEAYKNYTVGADTIRDPANATSDFPMNGATTVGARELVRQENCEQCHVHLQAHGGFRRDVKLCVLCHTSGSEDKNVASVEGGTPGASIDFRVMIHKIHDAAHLPSVLGVTTNSDGTRDYAATPQPYKLVGFRNSVTDFSDVGFPVWPSLTIPMPRPTEYAALDAAAKAKDDEIRRGVVACDKCHGAVGGTAPAQGDIIMTQPTRRACGSCHDDIDWGLPYTRNGQTMPPQVDDSGCTAAGCHPASGTDLAVTDAHIHPILNSDVNPGLVLTVTAVEEAAANDGDGIIDPGEDVEVTFTIADSVGNAVPATSLSQLNLTVSGPVENRQLILNRSGIVLADLVGPPYTQTFTFPATYPASLNASGDIGATSGDWEGFEVVPGTYTAGLWGARSVTLFRGGVSTSYTIGSPPANGSFLVENATDFPGVVPDEIEEDTIISSSQNCETCHDIILFHGGARRGYETCVLCHTIPGAEDRPQSVAANAPATTGVSIDFRTMLHKIHQGAELENAETYQVVGFGSAAAPNNFTTHTYEHVGFPAMPSGTKDCETCHGRGTTAWQEPQDRSHSLHAAEEALVWSIACGSCHDSDLAQAHIESNITADGVETCSLCHAPDREFNAAIEHKIR